jgi:hypothetical protein
MMWMSQGDVDCLLNLAILGAGRAAGVTVGNGTLLVGACDRAGIATSEAATSAKSHALIISRHLVSLG